jgi:hypothetical protein
MNGQGHNDGEPNVDTQNGFIKNTNVGLQYSNKWKDKQNLNVSPKFNKQITPTIIKGFLKLKWAILN